jgi:hypothetical protein
MLCTSYSNSKNDNINKSPAVNYIYRQHKSLEQNQKKHITKNQRKNVKRSVTRQKELETHL